MKRCNLGLIFIGILFSTLLPVSAQDRLVLSAVENTPTLEIVGEILTRAYQRLGIQLQIEEYPGLRGLLLSNSGKTGGEAFRIEGLEKEYPNLIRVDIPIQVDEMYLFVKSGNEFIVNGWESIQKDIIIAYRMGVKFIEYSMLDHGLESEPVASIEQLFLLLESERVDAIITGGIIGDQIIARLSLNKIIRLEPSIHTSYLYHYLHISHSDLVPRILKVLTEMDAAGEFQTIRNQLRIPTRN